MKWHTEVRKLSDLKEWDDNPRTISNKAYKELSQSIDSLGNFEPLVINTDGTVIAGNQRLKVHRDKGDVEVEVSVPERELTEEEVKKIGVISNRHLGEWDIDKLAEGFGDILESLSISDLLPETVEDEEEYSKKLKPPVYEPTGELPELIELVNKERARQLIDKVNALEGIPDDVREFLRIAATRFYVFDYSKIAEYYSHQEGTVKEIMEELALVVIDFEKAFTQGLVELRKELSDLYSNDYEE